MILIPESTPIIDENVIQGICRHIGLLRQRGRQFTLIVVAEGVRNHLGQKKHYIGDYLASQIQEYSSQLCSMGQAESYNLERVDTRVTTLGYLQRA